MKIFIIGAGPSNAYADLASPLKWTYAFVMIARATRDIHAFDTGGPDIRPLPGRLTAGTVD